MHPPPARLALALIALAIAAPADAAPDSQTKVRQGAVDRARESVQEAEARVRHYEGEVERLEAEAAERKAEALPLQDALAAAQADEKANYHRCKRKYCPRPCPALQVYQLAKGQRIGAEQRLAEAAGRYKRARAVVSKAKKKLKSARRKQTSAEKKLAKAEAKLAELQEEDAEQDAEQDAPQRAADAALSPLPSHPALCDPATHPGIDLTRDAQAMRRMLEAHEFPPLERALDEAARAGRLPENPIRRVEALFARAFWQPTALLPHADAWCKASPENGWAWLVRGSLVIDFAWAARGNGAADTVSDEDWKLYSERLQQARQDLTRAATLAPDEPMAPARLVTVAMGLNLGTAEARRCFDMATARDPRDVTAHANMLRFLMPRWHGDFRQMGAFVDERAAAVPDEPALGLLLLRLAQDAVDAGARLDAERLRLVDDAFERLHAAYPKWRLACRERVRLALSLKDDASAARWTIAGAEAGDAGLANDAGRLLMTGAFGTERDPERAVRFLCRAAHAGWVPAMEGLATAFARGDGVPASPEVAEAWRQAAAAAREAQRRAR